MQSSLFLNIHIVFFLTDECPSILCMFVFFAKVIFDYAMPPKCDDREMLKVLSLVRAAEDAAGRAPK